jgi:hypothetical protein
MRSKRASATDASSLPTSIHQCCHDCIIPVKSGSSKCRGTDQCRNKIGIACFNKNHVCLVCSTALCKCIQCSRIDDKSDDEVISAVVLVDKNQIITVQG